MVFLSPSDVNRIYHLNYCYPSYECNRLLGWRYFFNHDPGRWIPSCVSVTLCAVPRALAYPEFNADCNTCKVFTITFKGVMTEDVSNLAIPVSVNDWLDRQGTTAFIAVKLKIPSVAIAIWIDSNVSLVGDSKSGIVVQLVERTFLK